MLTNAQTLLLGRLPAIETGALRPRLGDATADILPTLPRHHLLVATEDHDPALPPLVLTPAPLPR